MNEIISNVRRLHEVPFTHLPVPNPNLTFNLGCTRPTLAFIIISEGWLKRTAMLRSLFHAFLLD